MNTPLHEAAHAIVARELGLKNIRATVLPGPAAPGRPNGSLGMAVHDPYSQKGRGDLEPIRRELAVVMAGPLADHIAAGKNPLGPASLVEIAARVLFKERPPCANRDGSWAPDARRWALEELTHEYGDELTAYQALDALAVPALRRTVGILRERWNEIEELAERLERVGTTTV